VKNLARFPKSEQLAIADKVILDGVMDRLGRRAQRQGAWWDDGHKIITSFEDWLNANVSRSERDHRVLVVLMSRVPQAKSDGQIPFSLSFRHLLMDPSCKTPVLSVG
jgi:hypothetical protein